MDLEFACCNNASHRWERRCFRVTGRPAYVSRERCSVTRPIFARHSSTTVRAADSRESYPPFLAPCPLAVGRFEKLLLLLQQLPLGTMAMRLCSTIYAAVVFWQARTLAVGSAAFRVATDIRYMRIESPGAQRGEADRRNDIVFAIVCIHRIDELLRYEARVEPKSIVYSIRHASRHKLSCRVARYYRM